MARNLSTRPSDLIRALRPEFGKAATAIVIGAEGVHGITMQPGGFIRIGTGTKDESLTGIQIDDTEIIAQNWLGTLSAADTFRLSMTGELYAADADITGTITANDGAIGGWSINDDSIYKTNAVLHSDGYISFGATPPTSYGSYVGVYLGYASGAKLSLYSDSDNYFQWDGTKLIMSTPFTYLDEDGNLTANDAILTGSVVANSGYIGGTSGWKIETGELTSVGIGLATVEGNATYAFWAGNDDPSLAEFSVTHAGVLSATGAVISGNISAITGSIGGWTVTEHAISATGVVLYDDGKIILGTLPNALVLSASDPAYRLYFGDPDEGLPFSVSAAGILTATGATISGSITATTGSIGGWTITDSAIWQSGIVLENDGEIRIGSAPFGLVLTTKDPTYRMFFGDPVEGYPFTVSKTGVLTATGATISGAITATSGSITGSLYVGDADPRILIDGANDLIKSTNYSPNARGFQIEGATGDAEFNNIFARGSIKTVVFEKALMSAFAGSQIVSKSAAVLAENLSLDPFTPGPLIVYKQAGSNPFSDGDIVRFKTAELDTWASVTLVGNPDAETTQYEISILYGDNMGTITEGAAAVDYGQAGDGYFAVSADGLFGAGAAWVLVSHNGQPWTDSVTQVYAGTDGRLYAGAGTVVLDSDGVRIGGPNGRMVLGELSDVIGGTLQKSGYYGLRIYDYAGVPRVSLVTGTAESPADAGLMLGAINEDNYLRYLNGELSLKGNVTATSGTIGGMTLADDEIISANSRIRIVSVGTETFPEGLVLRSADLAESGTVRWSRDEDAEWNVGLKAAFYDATDGYDGHYVMFSHISTPRYDTSPTKHRWVSGGWNRIPRTMEFDSWGKLTVPGIVEATRFEETDPQPIYRITHPTEMPTHTNVGAVLTLTDHASFDHGVYANMATAANGNYIPIPLHFEDVGGRKLTSLKFQWAKYNATNNYWSSVRLVHQVTNPSTGATTKTIVREWSNVGQDVGGTFPAGRAYQSALVTSDDPIDLDEVPDGYLFFWYLLVKGIITGAGNLRVIGVQAGFGES